MERLSSKALRDVMIAKCFGVTDLASRAGLTPVIVSKLLKSDSTCRLPTLSKLAKALQVDATKLLVNSN